VSPSKDKPKPKPSAQSRSGTLSDSAPIVESPTRLPFPVVGVGASAGGLEAFTQLLRALEPRLGMAFVLVPHLDPSHESAMSELLARATKMPVLQVTDGTRVKADYVYVIPPNSEMTISQGVLQLATRTPALLHMPIDTFLRSLATDQSANAIGIILSGTASDGTLGLAAIKGEAGITFAQDSDSAKYDGMPNSAIAAGCVDFVLPPAGIAAELARIRRHPYIAETRDERADELPPESSRNLAQVFQLLRQNSKVDFSEYKPATIRRRVFRRMALRKIEKLGDYVDYLRQHREEIDSLYQDILINVTSFFRNPDAFESLKQTVYPTILKARSPAEVVRVWVPGCSTGEEAYSHAIALIEHLTDVRSGLSIQIFGTDLSETAIQRARAGVYKDSIRADVSSTRLRRFFNKTEEGYQISKSIRDMCIFATQNVFDDPPFSRMDLVSCRNVLIYMGPTLQRRVIPVFHYALNPSGFLMVGDTEGLLGAGAELFELVDKKHKVYRKKLVPSPVAFGFSLGHYTRGQARRDASVSAAKNQEAPKLPPDLQREADRLLLAKYVPAAVVVNEHLDILQSRGHTGPYLELAPGKASLNLLKMLRPGLLFDVQKAMEHARKNHMTVRREDLEFENNGAIRVTNLEIIPFKIPPNEHHNFVIVFEDASPESTQPAKPKAIKAPEDRRGKDKQIDQLKQELAAAKEYLQSIIEAHEATNEELQSANEEIQSGNEELQSTNEELQTSKEELESANEELNTVNDEMQHRNQQLTLVNNDLTNLLNSVNIPTVMLGPDLSIRRFTPQAEKVLGFAAGDVGRPITHLRSKIKVPDLEQTLLDVIHEIAPRQLEVEDAGGAWYRLRITPYKTAENKIEGAVLTLLDMSDIKQSQEDVESQLALVEQALREMPCGLAITEAPSGKLLRVSEYLETILGQPLYPAANVSEYTHFQGLHPNGKPVQPEEWPMARALKGQAVNRKEITWARGDGRHVALTISSAPVSNRQGRVVAIITLFFESAQSQQAQS
jgi:two-component system, chemotaxis family, CheB/CheR fusion protein